MPVTIIVRTKGSAYSGNFLHKGRPGIRGGSQPGSRSSVEPKKVPFGYAPHESTVGSKYYRSGYTGKIEKKTADMLQREEIYSGARAEVKGDHGTFYLPKKSTVEQRNRITSDQVDKGHNTYPYFADPWRQQKDGSWTADFYSNARSSSGFENEYYYDQNTKWTPAGFGTPFYK